MLLFNVGKQKILINGLLLVITFLINACDSSSTQEIDNNTEGHTVDMTPTVGNEPTIALVGPNVIHIELNTIYEDQGVVAFDVEDGDISSIVQSSGEVNVDTLGDYFISYEVTDSHQNTVFAERLIRVFDEGRYIERSPRENNNLLNTDYYEKLPDNYGKEANQKYPLLIYFHGSGEVGNNLNLLINPERDLPKLINVNHEDFPFIAVLPQRDNNIISSALIDAYIDLMIKRYAININKIYLVGFSSGASQVASYMADNNQRIAAAVLISGAYSFFISSSFTPCQFNNIPTWYFHSFIDINVAVTQTLDNVAIAKDCIYENNSPLITIFDAGAHVIDDDVLFDNQLDLGNVNYDLFNTNVYTWLLKHSLN